MLKQIKKVVPKPVKSFLRRILFFSLDKIDTLMGIGNSSIPPRRLRFDGPKNTQIFIENGKEFFRYYRDLCEIKSNNKILDVGCGIGRKTIPLVDFLDEEGLYEGLDIIEEGIDWLKKNITKKFPNFNFTHVDVYNLEYNPNGKINASEFVFPYDDETFDLVVLGSVFTHMLPIDIENYISQISRVLKKGGKSLITFFLLDEEALSLINRANAKAYSGRKLDFQYIRENYRTIDENMPELAVAYELPYIVNLYKNNNLLINDPIYYGSWCGRRDYLGNQDMVVATKI
ncbi:MAG: class I SAM-dependent methyltransferase [Firmicutes bacterium]|nr:class I SAM-dependent methyltransferase [Bacillota bacterium]